MLFDCDCDQTSVVSQIDLICVEKPAERVDKNQDSSLWSEEFTNFWFCYKSRVDGSIFFLLFSLFSVFSIYAENTF